MGKTEVKLTNLIYRNGSLFKAAEPGAILLHSCNASGVWGAGIAKQFATRYPKAFQEYKTWCDKYAEELVGSYIKIRDKELIIACIFASAGYGERKDTEETIVKNTHNGVKSFLHSLPHRAVVNSPKINSGLFNVSWDTTEKIINHCLLDRPDITWVIWSKE